MQQIAHPCRDVGTVLDRGGHAHREGRSGHGAAGVAKTAVGAAFGDLQWLRVGSIQNLPANWRAVTVGRRQRGAAPGAGGRIVIHDMVRGRGRRQGRSRLARLDDGLLLVVLSSVALRSSATMRSRRAAVSRSRRSCPAQAPQSSRRAPWPDATALGPRPR